MSARTAAARAQQQAQQQAEDRERERLIQRWRELKPDHDRCFCGSTEDLRRYVAALEAKQARHLDHHLGQRLQRRTEHQHAAHEQEQPEREIEDEEIEP